MLTLGLHKLCTQAWGGFKTHVLATQALCAAARRAYVGLHGAYVAVHNAYAELHEAYVALQRASVWLHEAFVELHMVFDTPCRGTQAARDTPRPGAP